MNKKQPFVFMMLIAASLCLWAGGQKDSAAEGGKAKVMVTEWEIPFLNSLTGPLASIGEYLQWGAERAAWEINQAGGIAGKPVKILGIDTGNSPEQGTVEMSKLVGSALAVMGPRSRTGYHGGGTHRSR